MRNNLALKVLIVSQAIYYFAAMLMGPLYAVYIQKIGGGVLLISITTGTFYVATTLFLIFMARFGDRIRRKDWVLALSYIVKGLGFWAYIVANSSLILLLIQVVMGLAEALGTPTFGAIFAKHLDKKEEVMEYSDWSLIANLVMALGTILGGFIVAGLGFNFLFVVIGILCFVSAAGIFFAPKGVL